MKITLTAILSAINLLWEIVKTVKDIAQTIERNKNEKWFQDVAKVFGRWNDAKTTEDKKKLVRDYADLWRRL